MWSNYIVGLLVIFLAARKRFGWNIFKFNLSYKFLVWSVLGFKMLYAALETAGQYYIWSVNKFTESFLNRGAANFNTIKELTGIFSRLFDNKLGFFLFYSWGRFWMVIIVSLAAAAVFYLFLLFLKKYKERFFEEGEVEMGFLLALTIGWPNFIIFVPLAMVLVVVISIIKGLALKDFYTTLGEPFLISALIVLIWGNYLINLFHLGGFKI
jgi:hypothetical protein